MFHNGNSENLPSGNQINGTQLKLFANLQTFADGNKNAIKGRCTKNMSQQAGSARLNGPFRMALPLTC